ncbi:MAG: TonB-dependent receptor [Rhizomicrobium sp.]|jgi:hypothetical protein
MQYRRGIRRRIARCLAGSAFTALGAAGAAADDASSVILNYPASYFADARPNTAYDMISRLPGFSFNDGNSLRGFAGTAGNVLIDGERPTSKTDDLQSILQRMPASDVDRIDVIRGGETGIDMQGQTIIANVVRKKDDSTKVVADVEDNFWPDGHTAPFASLQFTQHADDSIYEASLTRYGNFDDSVGNGFHDVTDIATGSVARQDAHTTGFGSGGGLTGAATVPLFGGQFKANIALQANPFHSSLDETAPGNDQFIADENANNNGELGLHWNGDAGSVGVEALLLQRLGHTTDYNTLMSQSENEQFNSAADTGESIARTTLRFMPSAMLTFESGAEAVYNFLNGRSGFVDDGVAVPLPSANADVNEKRGEVFGEGTWKISDAWTLDAGARFEFSTIAETGYTDLSRSFFYPKPRAVLTWTPEEGTQIRLRYERVLGQLDFNNFIASSNLAANGVTAGNPDIEPDQHDQYEISYEKDFWDKGALIVTLMHEQIYDVQDLVPVTGTSGVFDAPGNIGTGQNNQVDVEFTVPLDKIGLTNGLLKTTNIWRFSSVHDPVTGELRPISGERPQDIEWTLTQDIDSLKSTWGVYWFNCWKQNYYRVEQVQYQRTLPPFLSVWWEYKPTQSWSIHLELDNLARYGYQDTFDDYAGPRNISPLESIDNLYIKSQPRLYAQVRKTFD